MLHFVSFAKLKRYKNICILASACNDDYYAYIITDLEFKIDVYFSIMILTISNY